MNTVCLDLEGVLVPEIWIAFSEVTGIQELRLTTRDISDYDVLMRKRIGLLKENNLKLKDIQRVIGTMQPLPGAKDFLDALREKYQVIILSDTFTQFAAPLIEKLSRPTLFCNTLEEGPDGTITGYKLRQNNGKMHAVSALKGLNMRVVASGDSYNDLAMLKAADKGILFRSPESIKAENPQFPAVDTYEDLYKEIQTGFNGIAGV